MPLQGACLRVLFALWMLVPLQCAAAVCRCKALLSECCLRLGVWLHVPLLCWCLHGATARCHCRMLLSGCRCQSVVRTFEFGCWCCGVLLQGAAAGCCCRVLLSALWGLGAGAARSWVLLPGTAAGCRCATRCRRQSAVCALELGCWCRCRVLLQGSACRVPQGTAVGCLQGACVGVVCALGLGCAGRRCRVPLQGAAVRVLLLGLVAGATAGPPCRVLLPKCCCQGAFCTLELSFELAFKLKSLYNSAR